MEPFSDQSPSEEDLLDLNEIMQAFGITTWQNLGPLEPSPPRSFNILVEVQGERYLLRARPEVMLGEDIQHRYDFQRYLQQQAIPIPALYLTPQGEPTVMIGEDYFELQKWIGGELFSSDDPHSLDWTAAAGAMLGRIHQAARLYPGHEHRWPSEAHIGGIVQSYLNLARQRAEQLTLPALSSALSNWVEQWEGVLPAAMMSIGAGRGLPEFHIHGDYHAHNLRFSDVQVLAVMGLEASRWEKRLFEIASALFSFAALAWQPGKTLTPPLTKRGFDPERAHRFLRAYREIYPPLPAEIPLLADALLLVAPIATVNGPLEDLFYMETELEMESLEDVMERITWAASLPAWLTRIRRSLADLWG